MIKVLLITNKARGGIAVWAKYFMLATKKNKKIQLSKQIPHLALNNLKNYQLVHLHEYSLKSLIILIACKIYKIPCIATLHSDCFKINSHYYWAKRNILIYLICLQLKLADRITVPSTYLQQILTKHSIAPRKKIQIIPNMADKNFIQHIKAAKKPKGKIRIIQITDFKYPLKARGVYYAIRAVKQLKNKNVELVIIGGRTFLNQFKKKFSSSNILFLGLKNHNETIAFIKSADIVIHPTLLDNTPISIIEAMLAAKPIITFDVGGIGELVNNAAIIANKSNLSKKLAQLINNHQKQKSLAKAAKRRSEKFLASKISKKFQLLYNSLIDDRDN